MRRLKSLGFTFSLGDFTANQVEEILAIDQVWKEYENKQTALPTPSAKRTKRK